MIKGKLNNLWEADFGDINIIGGDSNERLVFFIIFLNDNLIFSICILIWFANRSKIESRDLRMDLIKIG